MLMFGLENAQPSIRVCQHQQSPSTRTHTYPQTKHKLVAGTATALCCGGPLGWEKGEALITIGLTTHHNITTIDTE